MNIIKNQNENLQTIEVAPYTYELVKSLEKLIILVKSEYINDDKISIDELIEIAPHLFSFLMKLKNIKDVKREYFANKRQFFNAFFILLEIFESESI